MKTKLPIITIIDWILLSTLIVLVTYAIINGQYNPTEITYNCSDTTFKNITWSQL